MALIRKPVTGMKDILPAEMELRQYVLSEIRDTYRTFGFTEIETPLVEHIDNLLSKQGGDNEKLIFKIQKRGEKLEEALAAGQAEGLCDSGLRYDLTLPLARYYSANKDKLPSPFKALQIGPVFRADRPQKGRFRQFCQCDIDILGDASALAETELILATTSLLGRIGFGERYPYHVVINDRGILRGMQAYAGFPEADFEKICITLDKADKIGEAGVRAELLSLGYEEECVERYQQLLRESTGDVAGIRAMGERLAPVMDASVCENLAQICENVGAVAQCRAKIVFDPTLVRGMGYYTGPIFELKAEGFSGSIGGGGRYDKMVGRFTGQDAPAVGFSIGFERIITILMDAGEQRSLGGMKLAILMEKKLDTAKRAEALNKAMALRAEGRQVLLTYMNKNKKFQKEQLSAEGYEEIIEIYQNELR